jgi:hypothetical protein
MNIFFKEHKILLKKLITAGVKFIIVGGYAINYHGYNRTTGDLDIWIKPGNDNRDTLLMVLKELGFREDSLQFLRQADFGQPFAFHFWDEPYKVDIMTKISGVSFNEADTKKIIMDYEGLSIPFLDFHHLVLSKISTGRSRDQVDVEELQKIKKLKDQKPDR